MDFEFDPAKSASNLEKHGIDLDAIQATWQDGQQVRITSARRSRKEEVALHEG